MKPFEAGAAGGLVVGRALARRFGSSRLGVLLLARVIEQATLGIAALLLARWLGVADFAPISALLLFNSFAVVASDLGLGLSILSERTGAVGDDSLRRLRLVNLGVCGALVLSSVAASGSLRVVILGSAFIWISSGEAFVRKSALLRLGRHRRVAIIEAGSSASVLVAVAVAAAVPGQAPLVLALSLVTRHLVEVLGARGWRPALGDEGHAASTAVWWTQVLSYLTANVDFVIVGILISQAAFSIYSLAFRVAALVASQIGYAVGRVSLVDLAESEGAEGRQALYDRRVRQLFLSGIGAAVLSCVAAALMPALLGRTWTGSAWVVVLLAVGTPWRMALGLSGGVLVTQGKAAHLLRWEIGRLTVTAATLFVASFAGIWVFAGAATVLTILSATAFDRWTTSLVGLRRWRVPMMLVMPAVLVVAVATQIAANR